MNVRPLKKSAALARLEALREVVEGEQMSNIHTLAIIDTLLEYVHDPDFNAAVDAIPF